MKKGLMGATAVALVLAAGVGLADEVEDRCRQWAQEDGVEAAELQDYLAQCIEEQRNVAGAEGQQQD